MENDQETTVNYNDVVETLVNMFGDGIGRDILFTVAESVDGDLNHAANVVMNIMSDNCDTTDNSLMVNVDASEESASANQNEEHIPDTQPALSSPTISYSERASRNIGTSKNIETTPIWRIQPKNEPWSDQIRQIIEYHNQGSCTLILLRGMPGSGKSYLAKNIIEMTVGNSLQNYKRHVFSADDFFVSQGMYNYDRSRLMAAHDWNKERAFKAFQCGLSPIIVDNTNIEMWEMEPYFKEGVRKGYYVEVVEPNNPWSKKAFILAKKNIHNVPIAKIKRMLENFRSNLTSHDLFNFFNCQYPQDCKPPQLRNTPTFVKNVPLLILDSNPEHNAQTEILHLPVIDNVESTVQDQGSNNIERNQKEEMQLDNQNDIEQQMKYMKIQQQIEEIQKLEQEWENGEKWDEVNNEEIDKTTISNNPKPARVETDLNCYESMPSTSKQYESVNDWTQIALYLPEWSQENIPSKLDKPTAIVEKNTSCTCIELGDTDVENLRPGHKILIGKCKDINFYYVPNQSEKIPEQRMLDKSTMTKEETLNLQSLTHRCKNEEKHFVAFRKLFKTVPKAILRDVFDKCCGDVNWAVDIVLDSVAQNHLQFSDNEEISDTEEVNDQDCDCVAAYDIIPTVISENAVPSETVTNCAISQPQKKPKKETFSSESTLLLKRQIEENVVISDNYYSQHCLKIRKMRRGEIYERGDLSEPIAKDSEILPEENEDKVPPFPPLPATMPSTSYQEIEDIIKSDGAIAHTSTYATEEVSDDDCSYVSEPEKTVPLDLNQGFLGQLDSLFGRRDIIYPDNVNPIVNIPISIMNEINALWMESLMAQLDEQDKQSEKMLKEDEDFARQLESKENELAQAGAEPKVLSFKEIMDMDYAISLYQKDVESEWRNKTPNDLAAKFTRDKLFNLFPEVPQKLLTELLMAHENNFQATVEGLLISTGKSDVLEAENGLNKFVMEKELEAKSKILEQEQRALAEVEWPLLPSQEVIDITVVQMYRDEAERHLTSRNMNYQKAQEYVRRGMTEVAFYYSTLANFHKQKYEHANSLAAASLMQLHALNNPDNTTIDLHFLRVKEAREHLDLFLDTHIQNLKEKQQRGGSRYHTLFLITGRGRHSAQGRPRVKPAIKKRLRERRITFSERNPGLLCARVTVDHKLSYQISPPASN